MTSWTWGNNNANTNANTSYNASGFSWANNNNVNINASTSSNWSFGDTKNTTWTFGFDDTATNTTPWHYDEFGQSGSNVGKVRKQTVVPNPMDREYLVFGYGRAYSNASIPSDILDLCLTMYGMDGFSFSIKYDQLAKFHYYRSNTFCCNHMQFQIILKQKADSSAHQWGWSTAKELQFYIKLMNNDYALSQYKTAKIIAACAIYCTQLQKHFQTIINTSFEMIMRQDGMAVIDMFMFINENDIKSFDVIEFHGTLNILHVDILDTTQHILSVHHVNTVMHKHIAYDWELEPVLSPETKSYCSPSFGANHWNLLFQQPHSAWSIGAQCSLTLQLLQLPPNIACIRVLWRCVVQCNGVSYNNAKVQMLALKTIYCADTFQWSLRDFAVTKSSEMRPISFKVCVEIINAETREYNEVITDPEAELSHLGWDDWKGSSQINAGRTIPNKQFKKHGIVDKEEDAIKDWNKGRLSLQQQITSVKQTKNREASNANAPYSSWSYTNTIATPLYIEQKLIDPAPGSPTYDVEDIGGFSWGLPPEQHDEIKQASEWQTLDTVIEAKEEVITEEKDNTYTGLGDGFSFGIDNDTIGNKAYEWIETTLQKITPNHWEKVLNNFKKHEVTDERLSDLDASDWKEIIKRIGIRNEMRKLFNHKNEIYATSN